MLYSCFRSLPPFLRPRSLITKHSLLNLVTHQNADLTISTIFNSPQYKFSFQKYEQPHKTAHTSNSLRSLLDQLEKNRNNNSYDAQLHMKSIALIIKAADKRGKSAEESLRICQCIEFAFDKYCKKIENKQNLYQEQFLVHNIFRMVNFFTLQTVTRLLKITQDKNTTLQKIKNPKFLAVLLDLFQKEELRNKSQIIKFVALYHPKNEQAKGKIRTLLKSIGHYKLQNVNETIFFIKQLVNYYKLTEQNGIEKIDESIPLQFIQEIINYASQDIVLIDPKMLHIFSKFLVQIKQHERGKNLKVNLRAIEMGVEEHIKGLNMIESFNSIDAVYLLQVLENLVALSQIEKKIDNGDAIRKYTVKIYQMIQKIHRSDASESPEPKDTESDLEMQRELEGQPGNQSQSAMEEAIIKKQELRLIDVNIVLESMLKLSVIDPQLFSTLEKSFFKHAVHSNMMDIQFYIMARVRVTKAVIESLLSDRNQNTYEKLRLIKQEHVRFIVRLLQCMNSNSSLSLREKLKIIQVCQKVPVQSRKVKKIIASMSSAENVPKEEIGFAEIIMANF